MRKLLPILFLSLLAFQINAQDVQWASKVLDFSSELSPFEYSSQQILGKPNVLPQGGDNPNAWLPKSQDKIEEITVGFENPQVVRQIGVAESYNPSALYQVYLLDSAGNQELLNTFTPKKVDLTGRLLNIFFDETTYPVYGVRLVFNGAAVPGYYGIDAVAISNDDQPIKVEAKVKDGVNPFLRSTKLDTTINSDFEERRPLIAPDGKTLYFSRLNHPENIGGQNDTEDIWYSEWDENTKSWKSAKNMGEGLNNEGDNFISSITPDGKSMVVLLGNEYKKGGKMKAGVSIASKTSEGWTKPEKLKITNAYIEGTDGDYFLGNNRKTLIMAISRFDAVGGKDLYVSFLQDDGKWTEPMNLGSDINTAANEYSPYLAADNETLYFSSKGFSGFGGADIYISRRLDDTWTNWTEPENLGADINTDGDDEFFTIPPSGQYAFYSTGKEGENTNVHQIALPVFYQPAPVITVKGSVLDKDTKEPVMAKISYNLLPEDTEVGFTNSDPKTGEYEISLPTGAAYTYLVQAEGYASKVDSIDVLGDKEFREFSRIITLSALATTPESGPAVAVAPGTEAPAVNMELLALEVLFDFNADNVKAEYKDDLESLASLLKENTSIKLQVRGYSDSTGPKEYNDRLGERRAESVMKYLLEQGVAESQLSAVSYGEEKPKESNATREGRAANRRVSFKENK
ncbi:MULTISPECIES: OmpA family protein [Persicobacter]|uniref:OmpA-like domain-containing protein n=1 Tax=Persicobacter diffluens TaxID=981 RepID=A0AAN5AN22_9BACT|nr:OmpA family protein [Persicobacter sp. CCB-QB2]GJM62428.1 hypothetical protein PEDI_29800 [Persicobacter diffluens]